MGPDLVLDPALFIHFIRVHPVLLSCGRLSLETSELRAGCGSNGWFGGVRSGFPLPGFKGPLATHQLTDELPFLRVFR